MRQLKTMSVILSLVALLGAGCGQGAPGAPKYVGRAMRPVQTDRPAPYLGGAPNWQPGPGGIEANEELPPGAGPDEADFRSGPPAYVPDQLIVAVRPGARALLATGDGPRAIREFKMDRRYQVVQIPPGMSREQAIERVRRQPGVEMVAPNRIYSVQLSPNDAKFEDQWGLSKRFIKAEAAWEKGVNASGVTVAVLDTGVDYNHPELRGRVIVGPDLADGDNDPMDVHGHGTHVAGIIGAAGNNGEGIAGVAWNCKIMAIKVLSDSGKGSTDAVLAGIKHAVDRGAKIINMSLGTADPSIDPVLHMGLEYAHKRGVLVVAAAGNDGGQVGSPANDPYALAVSSTSHFWLFEWRSFFSNRGEKIELAAPGGGIWSLLPVGQSTLGRKQGRSMYGKLSGTSMAAPFVSGEAALVWAQHPNWTLDQVKNRLRQAVDDKGKDGRDNNYGFGRINLSKALD